MLNNELDFEPYRRQLAQHSRVQIPDVLQATAAERIRDCLQREVPWTLAERSRGQPRTIPADELAAMPEADYRALLERAQQRAGAEFQFVYDSYMMRRAALEGRDPGLLLHAVLEFMNSPEYLQFVRWFTGDARITEVNAQATRYRPGHFLTRHEDHDAREGRLYAYVLNLTPRWDADWGGLLQFVDADGQVVDTLLPRWNSLSMFRVPQSHSVTLVAAWAGEHRLAITGWLLMR